MHLQDYYVTHYLTGVLKGHWAGQQSSNICPHQGQVEFPVLITICQIIIRIIILCAHGERENEVCTSKRTRGQGGW